MVEFYYDNVNFCEGSYSPKLLATSPSNLQIMSVLFSYKLISLNIWVAKFKGSIVLRVCAHSDANIMKRTLLSLTQTTWKTIAKKPQKLTRFLSGCLFVYSFCQFLQVDPYLRTENFTNTCQRARFREHRHDC